MCEVLGNNAGQETPTYFFFTRKIWSKSTYPSMHFLFYFFLFPEFHFTHVHKYTVCPQLSKSLGCNDQKMKTSVEVSSRIWVIRSVEQLLWEGVINYYMAYSVV